MINDAYQLESSQDKIFFEFESVGKKGVIKKVIVFQTLGYDLYNLAFGDRKGNNIDDKIVSDNGDLVKIISTVAQSVYDFIENYPNAIIEIQGVDKKRLQLYNHVFRRRKEEIEELFELYGVLENGRTEPYAKNQFYKKFVIKRKNN